MMALASFGKLTVYRWWAIGQGLAGPQGLMMALASFGKLTVYRWWALEQGLAWPQGLMTALASFGKKRWRSVRKR